MITLIFTNGKEIKTRCTKVSAAIRKALDLNPVRGTIAGTKMARNGTVFAVIDYTLGYWDIER